MKKTSGKSTNYPFHKPEENHPPGKDSTKKISNLIGKATMYAGSAKSKKVRFAFHICTLSSTGWLILLLCWLPNPIKKDAQVAK